MKIRSCLSRAILAAILSVFALTEAAEAEELKGQPKQWVCRGSAKGTQGDEASIDWYVEGDGTVVGRSASWIPHSHIEKMASARAIDIAADLTIVYNEPNNESIGTPSAVLLSVFGPKWIKGSSVDFKVEGNGSWHEKLTPFQLVHTDKRIPDRVFLTADFAKASQDLLIAISSTGNGSLWLVDKTDRIFGLVRYDFSGVAERENLYKMAWAAAERAATNPMQCEETVDR